MYVPAPPASAAAAKSDDEAGDDSTGDKHQSRGRSKDRGRKRSQTPGKVGVCRASSRVTGDRTYACAAPEKPFWHNPELSQEGVLRESYRLSSSTPSGRVFFGTVRIFARTLSGAETIAFELEPVVRYPEYKHPSKLRDLPTGLAAECAIHRALDLIEQIKDDERDEWFRNAEDRHRMFKGR